jgi:hypothetical protein
MSYWEISPHINSDYDYAVLPGDTEEDHRAALEYATEMLNTCFDALEEGDKATVTVKLCKGEMPEEEE